VYGKVFIAAKPKGASYLTEQQKTDILSFIKKKNVITVTPEIVDPDYTYLFFNVFFRYNKSATPFSQAQMESVVREKISTYNDERLANFDRLFRYSTFLASIDAAHPAILNSLARVYVYKEFGVLATNRLPSLIDFKMAFYGPSDQVKSIISSTPWRFNNQYLYLADEPNPSSAALRRVYAYRLSTDAVTRIKVFPDVGTLDITTGRLELDALPTDYDDIIKIIAIPDSNDIVSIQNQMLTIDVNKTTILGSNDTSPSDLEIGNSKFVTFSTTAR
jgi:hypothetical protein